MEVITEVGERIIEPGEFTLFIGGNQPDSRSNKLVGSECLRGRFTVKD